MEHVWMQTIMRIPIQQYNFLSVTNTNKDSRMWSIVLKIKGIL